MQGWLAALKGLAYLVLVLLAVAMAYGGWTALRYWPDISV
ncbi:hypothetical protein FHS03_004019 [Massilia violacea]|uniref:Uncharacterized protein n=1 Tax=Pseudoduganella violacea TaxID=1715466 RepID=A0A7W5BD45_9BURK|nr:hypothetical protein [Pseudoduganella violacea]